MHLTAEKKAQKEAILQAIDSLKSQGRDVNPYSVAIESGIPRQYILRDAEVMAALSTARITSEGTKGHSDTVNGNGSSSDTEAELQRLHVYIEQLEMNHEALNRELDQSHWDVQVLRKQVTDLEAEKNKLRAEAETLQTEAQNIAKSVNLAWQQGYLAGQHAATTETQQQQKSFVESLAEAAKAATTSSDELEPAVQPVQELQQVPETNISEHSTDDMATEAHTVVPTLREESFQSFAYNSKPELTPPEDHDPLRDSFAETETTLQPMESVSYFGGSSNDWKTDDSEPYAAAVEDHTAESEPYVADIELKIEDPELLNDPFTAKLMEALHGGAGLEEQSVEDVQPVNELPENYIYSQSYSEDPPEAAEQAPVGASVPPPPPIPETSANDGWSTPSQPQFDEPELNDEPPPPPAAPPPIPQGARAFREEGETTQNFTADELHNLFRNKVLHNEAPQPAAVPPPEEKQKDPAISTTTKKFVGSKAASSAEPLPTMRSFPPDIRKACRLLGLNPEEISKQIVLEAWKKEMAKPGVHPDTGGDTEMAIYLNTAKDTLVRWLEGQAPKLGKKFGAQAQTREHQKPQPQPKQD